MNLQVQTAILEVRLVLNIFSTCDSYLEEDRLFTWCLVCKISLIFG